MIPRFRTAAALNLCISVRPCTVSDPHARCHVCLTESSHLLHPLSNLSCLNHLHSLSSTSTIAATRHPRTHHLFDEAQTTRIEFVSALDHCRCF
ncbi:hypothetical protein D8674_014465 [Pyrus ussuriensis x Pyrus communis]|uniref:Uncharacterized protein n=1 Tax=Pyrus ussuriensis x Pyrus communis TaxID=2448454 RepID=A0A5N5GSM4_9ROSA|nr:hypothetical protein D8674_014465 [Pyrus ussuriensis x Pyrus communis]